MRGAEVVQQARAREEVEPRGGGARARERLGVWEEEELEVVDRGEVRAAAAGVNNVSAGLEGRGGRGRTGCGRRRR